MWILNGNYVEAARIHPLVTTIPTRVHLQKSSAANRGASCFATMSRMYSARTESMVGISRAEKFRICPGAGKRACKP